MYRAPWDRLRTPMTPKISEKPEAKRKRIAPYEIAFNRFSKNMFMKG
jgi:hypothetical protein